jgi:hypothetical protein
MVFEVARLLLGVMLMTFHRPIADFFVEMDHISTAMFRAGGLNMPGPPRQAVMHTIYFCMGIIVCVVSMAKIYAELPR